MIRRFRAARERILPEGPGKIGYFLGYRILETHAVRHGEGSWRDFLELPLRRILEDSGYLEEAPREELDRVAARIRGAYDKLWIGRPVR